MRGQTALRCRALAISPPSACTWPDWIFFAPAMSPIRVDLPTPSGPISPTMHPDGISIDTASSARARPYRWVTSVTVATGGLGPGIGAPAVGGWEAIDSGFRIPDSDWV